MMVDYTRMKADRQYRLSYIKRLARGGGTVFSGNSV